MSINGTGHAGGASDPTIIPDATAASRASAHAVSGGALTLLPHIEGRNSACSCFKSEFAQLPLRPTTSVHCPRRYRSKT